jgi:hypothetical protein
MPIRGEDQIRSLGRTIEIIEVRYRKKAPWSSKSA